MSDALVITLTAGLVATAAGLLGPFLVLRRVALMSDAVAHAVLPGIVLAYVVLHTRAPLPVVLGAALFAIVCVLAVDALRASGLVAADAAIALVFPALFALGVLGVTRWASGAHLDLDATIYGEIAFVPFRTTSVLGAEVAVAPLVLGAVCLLNLLVVLALWKELRATTFDPQFSRTIGLRPELVGRSLLVLVAVTAVAAFEAVGAILVVALLIVPAAAAQLVTRRLWATVAVSVGIGWVAAIGGRELAAAFDASIAGAMGLVATACFAVALLGTLRPRWASPTASTRSSRRSRATGPRSSST
jgi:manganese/zinc/iron transport system permease protein